MSEPLKVGMTASRRITIDTDRTISFMGDDCRVYATPMMVRDIETVCREFIKEHVDAGKDSVGTRVELDHTGPTLLGMWVEISVTVTKAEGPAVSFDVIVRDALDQVGNGKHNRFIVDVAKQAQRLQAKRAKLTSV